MAESRRRDALALLRNGQVDGADFYCGDEELGHIHLNGEVHLATSPAITRALIAAGAADRFPCAGAGEWITYRIGSDAGSPCRAAFPARPRLSGRHTRICTDRGRLCNGGELGRLLACQ